LVDLPADSPGVALVAKLAPRLDGDGLIKAKTPHRSAWRGLIIGRNTRQLIENELIRNLSLPSQLQDTSWIKPGAMACDTWSRGDTAITTDGIKKFIRLAAEKGWPCQLIDRNWYGKPNQAAADITRAVDTLDMTEIRRFAEEKCVRLWLWVHWQDLDRNEGYKQAFPLYKDWGIAGVTIGCMDRSDQEMVQWYEVIIHAAAESELLLSVDGAFKPTGLDRTFPNQQTAESPILKLSRKTPPFLNREIMP
jgi:alpha-glucosidase